MARPPRQVFISAAPSDHEVARILSDTLERAGLRTWDSSAVVPGANSSSEAGEALRRSDCLVVLVSPDAMQSQWIRHEITYALGEQRFENRVIPILVKRTPRSDIPWALNALNWLEGKPDEVAESLVKALQSPSRAEAR